MNVPDVSQLQGRFGGGGDRAKASAWRCHTEAFAAEKTSKMA